MPNSRYCTVGSSKERVIHLLHRAEQGLPSYDRLSQEQLRTIADRRCPNRPGPRRNGRRELIASLEKADLDGQKFRRFMDLPPELRVRIYEFHFESFDALYGPADPPITKVSTTVRQESLALFYQQVRYDITFEFIRKDHSSFDWTRLPRGMFHFLRSVDERRKLWIRHLRVGYTILHEAKTQSWNIDISPDRKSFQAQECPDSGVPVTVRDIQLARLDKIFREVMRSGIPRVLYDGESLVPLGATVHDTIKDRYGRQ